MNVYKSLNEKAVLVRHIIHKTSFRKFDREVTHKIAQDHSADLDKAGRFNKILIERDALADINSVINAAYQHHVENTLPWDDSGARLLPSENYFAYTEKQREFQDRLTSAVEAFAEDYPRFIDEARKRLNGMFRERDYPDVGRVRQAFGIEVKVRPVPNADDIRIGVGDKEAKRIKQQIEADMQQAINDAIADLWRRAEEDLTLMRDRLTDYAADDSKRFYHAWINNVRALVDTIGKLNFTKDKNLEATRAQIAALLDDVKNEQVKESPQIASNIASEADAILKQMAAYTG